MKLISCKFFKNYNDNALSAHIGVPKDKMRIAFHSGMWVKRVRIPDWSFDFSAFPKSVI